jgi:copper resistance protein D
MAEYAIASQFVHFAAVLVLFGASLFRLYVGADALRDRGGVAEIFDRWLRKILLVAAILALVSALAWWDSLAVTIGDGWSDALNAEVVKAILFETEFGRIWMWRLALLTILIGTLVALRGVPWRRRESALVAVLAAAAILSLAGIGHAARDTGLDEAVHFGGKAVHLLAAAVWLGGLVPLGYVLLKASKLDAWAPVAAHVLPRFSSAGYFAVSLILLSGCVISWFHVGSWNALTGTSYGRVLVAKVLLFLLMSGIALFNRLALTPAILPSARHAGGVPAPIAMLTRSVAFEQIVGVSILLVASVLATLPPAHAP